jgi:hypothetical protein
MIQGIVGWQSLSITQVWLAKRCGDGLLRGEGLILPFLPVNASGQVTERGKVINPLFPLRAVQRRAYGSC